LRHLTKICIASCSKGKKSEKNGFLMGAMFYVWKIVVDLLKQTTKQNESVKLVKRRKKFKENG